MKHWDRYISDDVGLLVHLSLYQDYQKAYGQYRWSYQSYDSTRGHRQESEPQGPFQYCNIPQIQRLASRIGLDLMGYALSVIILRPLSMQYRRKVYQQLLKLLDQVGIRDNQVRDWIICDTGQNPRVTGYGLQDQGITYISDLQLVSSQGFQVDSIKEVLKKHLGSPSMLDL